MQNKAKSWILATLCLMASCAGGGSGAGDGGFVVLGTNVTPGSTRKINLPLEFYLSAAVDEDSLGFTSISIEPVPSANAGAPQAGPVSGEFFLKPGSGGKTIVFQPGCPGGENPNWGLTPGNQVEGVIYRVSISNQGAGRILRSAGGAILGETFTLEFVTASPPESVVADPEPGGAPDLVNAEDLPQTLGLNLLSETNSPLELVFDQPLNAETVGPQAVYLSFFQEGLGRVRIPAEVVLTENCTSQNGAVMTLTPVGVLPPGTEVQLTLSGEVEGLGGASDSHGEEIVLLEATVQDATRPVQGDSYLERFDDLDRVDENPAFLFPLAEWGNGHVQAGRIYPGNPSDITIEIGPGTNNGTAVLFNTSGQTLLDTDGREIFFANGVMDVGVLHLKEGGNGALATELRAIGPNPLIIRATREIIIEDKAQINVAGGDASDVFGVGTANQPAPGGLGQAGGGDGGLGSPQKDRSSARGGTGSGPWNLPFGGAMGGHSAFGDRRIFASHLWQINARPAGGGGGMLGGLELGDPDRDGIGDYVAYRWGQDYWKPVCDNSDPDCDDNDPNACRFERYNFNTLGETGSNGAKCVTSDLPLCTVTVNGIDYRVCQLDAIDGTCLAKGGEPGPPLFADGDPSNNFFGRKPVIDAEGNLEIITGEIAELTPGQGGGGGGDAVRSETFPSEAFVGSHAGAPINMKAAGGGGGAGIVKLSCLGPIRIDGRIFAHGGAGGQGEESNIDITAAGGGGGGSGGVISIETPSGLYIGDKAFLNARGGDRGWGGGAQPGWASAQNQCNRDRNAARGAAGGKGIIQFHLPFVEESDTCGGITQPMIAPEALKVRFGSNEYDITCERDLTEAGHEGILDLADWDDIPKKMDPSPQILVPTFGSRTGVQSAWIYSGWQEVLAPVRYAAGGIDPVTGMIDPGHAEVIASGSGGATLSGDFQVTLTNASLAEIYRSAPQSALADSFRPEEGAAPRSILAAVVEGDRITFDLDPSGGAIGSVGEWAVLQRTWQALVNGGPAEAFPETATVQIFFQGADPVEPGSTLPDPDSITAPTAELSELDGRQLIRFRVLFETNRLGGEVDPFLDLPGLDFLKIRAPF